MKKQYIICDRCKKEIDFASNNRGFHIYKHRRISLADVHEHDSYLDLCQKCYDSLWKWWRESEDKE